MRVGSLFAGYGGIDLGLSMVWPDARPAWFVEFDKHPSAILAKHWPDVPNYGDITRVDWSAVEPVDVLTGGFPCQDVSHAGNRAGIKPGTRSGLWSHMAYAIAQLRPRLVVIENVSGLLSADAAGDVEPCPWCLGDEPAGHLRALGAVLADLAEIGFDAEWVSVRASDAGAPHRRERVFIVARPADTNGQQPQGVGALPGLRGRPDARSDVRLPASDDAVTLLPTPAVNDMGAGKDVEDWDAWTDAMRAKHGNGHGKSLAIEVQRLLPTPRATDGEKGGPNQVNGRGVRDSLPGVVTLLPTPTSRDHKGPNPNQRTGGVDQGTSHAPDDQTNTGAVLPSLRDEDETQEIRGAWAVGGHDPVHEPEDVWPGLRINEDRGDEKRAALASQEAPQAELRGVRDSQRPARTSHRQEPREQRPGQPDDAVLVMSPETALAGGPRQADAGDEAQAASAVRDMRLGVPSTLGEEADVFAGVQGESVEPEDDPTRSGAWGPYAPAVRRWAIHLGRPAPAPTELNKDGRHRLSPRAVEFMMGLPEGWVTDAGIPRNAQLKALGNGVMPQQLALALTILLPRLGES